MKISTKEKTEMMGTAPVWRVLAIMAGPGILAQLSHTLYNLVDRFFMGQYVGSNALGAISLTTPLINIMAGLSLLITIGGAALLSMNLGMNRMKDARVLFSNLLVQALATSFLLALIYFIFAPNIIRSCGADETSALYESAVLYLRITSFGLMFQLLNAVQASIIRAEGNVSYSLVVSVIGGGVNIILDAILIVGFRMGVAGAAYATVASQVISAVISTIYFFSGKSRMKWMGFSSLDLKLTLSVVKTGMAPAVLQALSFLTGVMLNKALRRYGDMSAIGGDMAISAMSVILTSESIFSGVVMGINQAASPIISYNYGAKKYHRVKQATLLAVTSATLFTTCSWLLMMFCPQALFRIFSNDVSLAEYGVHAMRLNRIFAFGMGAQSLCSMFYSNIGKPKLATIMSVLKQGVFLIPALLILPRFYGLDGVLLSTSFSDFFSIIIIVVLYLHGIKRLPTESLKGNEERQKLRNHVAC